MIGTAANFSIGRPVSASTTVPAIRKSASMVKTCSLLSAVMLAFPSANPSLLNSNSTGLSGAQFHS